MANKPTHERVSALLTAGPDKASHDTITGLQGDLQTDIGQWHERLAAIEANGNHIGPERRRVLETGSVEDAMKLEIESQQLRIWIERARAQSNGLTTLAKQVFARESLANLPAQFTALIETLGAIAEVNKALSEGWSKVEQLTSEIEIQRRAVAESGEGVPTPPEALGEALTAGWRGSAPVPMSGAFTSLHRDNVAQAIGLRSEKRWVEGVSFDAAA